jgi:SAM-dependent methyltransferase
MSLRFHEIAEARHRILNPFTEDKLMLLGAVCRLRPGQRILDLACGKGELLARWAAEWGTGGVGVDISEVFVPAARRRVAEFGVADRVEIVHGDASSYRAEPASFDVVACVGATWIGGGVTGTIGLLRPALRSGGLMLIGEPYWIDTPPSYPSWAPEGEFTTLGQLNDAFEAAGMELVEMVLADGDSWDRYVAAQWMTLSDFLREHPDDPEAGELRAFLDDARRSHLDVGRRFLGWGVFVLRAAHA